MYNETMYYLRFISFYSFSIASFTKEKKDSKNVLGKIYW